MLKCKREGILLPGSKFSFSSMLLTEVDPQKRRSHQENVQQYDDSLDKNQEILLYRS